MNVGSGVYFLLVLILVLHYKAYAKKEVDPSVKIVKKAKVTPLGATKDIIKSLLTVFHPHPREKKGTASKSIETHIKDPYDKTKSVEKIKSNTNVKENGKRHGIGRRILKFVLNIFSTIGKFLSFLLSPVKDVGKVVGKVAGTVLPIPTTKGLDTNSTLGSVLEKFKETMSGIYPGTKWCGAGNMANNYSDLGELSITDNCCRNHDNCPKNIAAGETKFGLKNNGLFTRSDCSCDKEFYNCLKKANTAVAEGIGYTYFTNLGPQCFTMVDCSMHNVTCRSKRKTGTEYHWTDNPTF